MDAVISDGQMARNILEIGRMIRLKAKVFSNGLMGESIRVNGKKVKCMERVYILGQMEGNILENL